MGNNKIVFWSGIAYGIGYTPPKQFYLIVITHNK